MWKWIKEFKKDLIVLAVVFPFCVIILLLATSLSKKEIGQVPIVSMVVQVTEYSALDDGLRPGQKGFNLTFTGETPLPDYTCAIDPIFWSQQFNLLYNKKDRQEKRAQAEIFKRLVILIEDQYGRLTTWKANDTGGGIKKGHLDLYTGKDDVARKKARMFGSQYRKVYAFLKFDE